MKNKNTSEIIFFARGGQGAKTASELLAHAAVHEGKFVKAFPYFGPERSGAPTKMYLRVSEKEIRTQEPIVDPNVAIVMDETVIGNDETVEYLGKSEIILVNSKKDRKEIKKEFADLEDKIHAIDATGMALEMTGNPNPNMVLIGKFLKLSDLVSLDSVEEIFREYFTSKLGKDLTEKNIRALQAGYDSL